MSDNVRALPGVVVQRERGEVDATVVLKMEELLADARSGTIKGVAYACLSREGMVKAQWVGDGTTANEMHGAIALLSAWFADARVRDLHEDG